MKEKLINIVLIISILAFSSSCKKKKKDQNIGFPVSITKSFQKDSPIFIESIGHVDPLKKIDVRSRVEGELIRVTFKEGDEVKAGDLLFVIDPRNYEANLIKTKGALDENMANLSLAKDKADRYATLIKDEYISPLDFETLVTNVKKYQALVRQNQADLTNAEINLGYCRIDSPVNGKTGILNYDKGNLIGAEDQTPLITINQLSPIYVLFSIPEKDLHKVKQYQKTNELKVRVTFDSFEKFYIDGSLNLIDNEVDTKVGMIKIRGLFENENRDLWPGQFVRTRLILTIEKDAIIVPYQSIQITPSGPVVFIVKSNNTVEMKKVTLGQREDENIIIKKGVKTDETIVLKGQINLYDGAKIFISEEG